MFKRYLLTICFILNASILYAEASIYYVDIDYILNNSKPGVKIISTLDKSKKKNDSELDKLKKNIKSKNDEIAKNKNLISEKEIKTMVEDLRNQIANFENKKKEYSNNFKIKQQKMFNELLVQVNELIKDYMEKNSIEIILNKKTILVAKSNLNLTNEILKIVNKELN